MSLGLLRRNTKNLSWNEILPRLYLGDINTASNKDELIRLGITDMITVEMRPIPQELLPQTLQRYLFINVLDHSKQDLLSHFHTSNEFIETALKTPSNKVYVHCVAGVSRSATIVIAYIMKTRCMSYQEARDLVSQKRRVIDPNEGFVCQLMLYHRMGYKLDINNLRYRRIVFEALVFEYRFSTAAYQNQNQSNDHSTHDNRLSNNANNSTNAHNNRNLSHKKVIFSLFPASFGFKSTNLSNQLDKNNFKKNLNDLFAIFFNKLHLQEVKNYPDTYDTKSAYRCVKCRSIVFFPISLIQNDKISMLETFDKTNITDNSGSDQQLASAIKGMERLTVNTNKAAKPEVCPFYFIEPQPWMLGYIYQREGDLECYKCKKKLGKFDWNSREGCVCELHNSHLNVNLFKIMRKNVDLCISVISPSDQLLAGPSSSIR